MPCLTSHLPAAVMLTKAGKASEAKTQIIAFRSLMEGQRDAHDLDMLRQADAVEIALSL